MERIKLGEAWAQAASEYIEQVHKLATSLRLLDKAAYAREVAAVRAARVRSENARQALADHVEQHRC